MLSLLDVTVLGKQYHGTNTFPVENTYRRINNNNTVEPPVSDHPKMSSEGGRLREVVAYESLDHNGSKFFLI